MTNSIKTTKYSAIFLAAILVAGTIALSNSSFIVGAQAQQFNGMDQRYNSYEPEYGTDNKYNSYEPEYGTDYGMDSYDKKPYGKDSNSYDKSKDSSSVTVKKIKCNNINVNLNGFSGNEIGTSPTSGLGALATEAQAEDEGANGANFGNDGRGGDGRPSGSDTDSRFVCIDNNDNTVVEEEAVVEEEEEAFPPRPPIEIEGCEGCFLTLVSGSADNANALISLLNTQGIQITLGAQNPVFHSLINLCTFLDVFAFNDARVQSAVTQIIQQLENGAVLPDGTVIQANFTPEQETAFLECLKKALNPPSTG